MDIIFSQGYKCRNAYIATQCPLVSTADSFWRMLYEFKSGVVVTLCSPQHDKGVCYTVMFYYYFIMCVLCLELFTVLARKRDRLWKYQSDLDIFRQ